MIDTLKNKNRPAQILLVEDNPGDIKLTQIAFRDAAIENVLTVAKTGEQALQILYKEDGYADVPRPDLILLDLNLPGISGHEVLEKVKNDPHLKRIPVIILSSSKAESDVVQCYDKYANGYIVKPVKLDNFGEIVKQLESFWFMLAVVPDENDASKAGE